MEAKTGGDPEIIGWRRLRTLPDELMDAAEFAPFVTIKFPSLSIEPRAGVEDASCHCREAG